MVLERLDLVRDRTLRCDANCACYARGRHAPQLDAVVRNRTSFLAAVAAGYPDYSPPKPQLSCVTIEPSVLLVDPPLCVHGNWIGVVGLDCMAGEPPQSMGKIACGSAFCHALAAEVL